MSISQCKRTFEKLREAFEKSAHNLAEGNAFEYEHWMFCLNRNVRTAMNEAIEWADIVETSERRNRVAKAVRESESSSDAKGDK